MTTTIVTITGPTCSGKTYLENYMSENGFVRLVSHTTRRRREGETDADYFFVEGEAAFSKIPMVETIRFEGNMYGLSVEEANEKKKLGKPLVLNVTPLGRKQIQEFCANNEGWQHIAVWVSAPTEKRIARLAQRKDEKDTKGLEDRLNSMLTTEREWSSVEDGKEVYDLCFNRWGNPEPVVNMIKDLLEK